MQTGNTFTYRHSELPVVRPAIKAEIAALDVQIADLTLRSQGNYRELEELAEVLDNCLDGCELNLSSIRIIADDIPQPIIQIITGNSPTVSMRDLSIEEKQIIFSTAITSSIAIEALASICHKTPQQVASELAEKAREFGEDVTTDQIESVIDELIEMWKAKPGQQIYSIELDSD